MVSCRRERIFRGKYNLTDLYQDVLNRRLGEDTLIRTTQGRVFARTIAVGHHAIDILFVRAVGNVPDANSYEFTPQDMKVLIFGNRLFEAEVEYDSGNGSEDGSDSNGSDGGCEDETDSVAENNNEGTEPEDVDSGGSL